MTLTFEKPAVETCSIRPLILQDVEREFVRHQWVSVMYSQEQEVYTPVFFDKEDFVLHREGSNVFAHFITVSQFLVDGLLSPRQISPLVDGKFKNLYFYRGNVNYWSPPPDQDQELHPTKHYPIRLRDLVAGENYMVFQHGPTRIEAREMTFTGRVEHSVRKGKTHDDLVFLDNDDIKYSFSMSIPNDQRYVGPDSILRRVYQKNIDAPCCEVIARQISAENRS